jgi:hypothetical protein
VTWTVEVRDAQTPPDGLRPRLLWTDPPYGTGKSQSGPASSYVDGKDEGFLWATFENWLPLMADDGVVCVCLDSIRIHQAVEFIRSLGWCHRGDVIWGFGLGRQRTSWWGVRHNTIATFTRSPDVGVWRPRQVKSPRNPSKHSVSSLRRVSIIERCSIGVLVPRSTPLEQRSTALSGRSITSL